ncbi:MAG: FKBP-type peptidyl-prolyl cis-trans isomerase [Firmicutes bacterium]|nr:FKBP-type peptidyl-prolyl cis-trans isomerase [Bacillota bacterium]
MLSLIPAFFIGRRLAGNVGGFFAASMLVLNAAVMGRTPWGHADTDAYNIFFPMLIIWLFIESIVAKDYKKKLGLSIITAFCLGVFTKAWAGGWWYVFYFVLAAMFINLLYLLITNRKRLIDSPIEFIKGDSEIKNIIFVTVVFFIFSGIFVSLFTSIDGFVSSISAPFSFTIIKSASHATLWPNVYTTVAELNPASVSTIIEQAGGKLIMLIAVVGILLTLTIKDSMGKRDIKYALLLGIWFVATIYASTKGIRFVLLMIPAFSIAFGVAAGLLYRWITKWMKKDLKIPKIASGTVIVILFLILLISPAQNSYAAVKGNFPLINDAWWNTLTKIKTDSAPDAIINSWWDFGHHFKFIADRAVTFDGATQNYPHAHWIGRVLSTDNELEAVGILRMLDCGSNLAFETLDKTMDNTHKSVDIIYQIIMLDKENARQVLQKYISNPNDVLQYTHCSPPEDYFIASSDMVQKAGVWAHFGNWDFERADIWMNLKNLPRDRAVAQMIEKYNYSEDTAESMYLEVQSLNDESEANSWISSWPGYASGLNGCEISSNIVKCGNGAFVNLNSYDVRIQTQNGEGIPKSLVYIDKQTNLFVEKEFNDSNIGLSVLLIPSGKGYTSVLVSPELANSMFTRLFFFKGHGLKYFDLFNEQRQVTGGDIFTWKVDWTGSSPNIHPDLIEKSVAADGDSVIVEYIGWLDDNSVFDSSIVDWENKNISKDSDFNEAITKPLKFNLGSGQTIAGFDSGIKGMKLNAVKTLIIAPKDAYGTDPDAHPLGNQTLYFKVKVTGIE